MIGCHRKYLSVYESLSKCLSIMSSLNGRIALDECLSCLIVLVAETEMGDDSLTRDPRIFPKKL